MGYLIEAQVLQILTNPKHPLRGVNVDALAAASGERPPRLKYPDEGGRRSRKVAGSECNDPDWLTRAFGPVGTRDDWDFDYEIGYAVDWFFARWPEARGRSDD